MPVPYEDKLMMKTAEMFSVPSGPDHGYAWKWRCADVESKESFTFYFDCYTDAKKRGYTVELTRAHGVTAPGGALHRLV
jgi:hypothetical protein